MPIRTLASNPVLVSRYAAALLSAFLLCSPPGAGAADWPPISKEELAMADDPSNPGAAAIVLYRDVNTDDAKGSQTEYRRIKVLKDDGTKFGDIEIPYVEHLSRIEDIQARTVRPDGTTVDFRGQIFDRTAIKARKAKVQVKAFTLPEVQKGGILEYSYTIRYRRKIPDILKKPEDYLFDSAVAIASASWVIQEDLFTRRARFAVHPVAGAPLHSTVRSVPVRVNPVTQADGTLLIELENIPAFQTEDYMLPEQFSRGQVIFYYLLGPAISRRHWEAIGSQMARRLKPFFGDPKKLKPILAGIVSAGDSPETQLRKLYARVQQIRYLTFEPSKTEQQAKRENLKENKNVQDVLQHNYAAANEINLVFAALARAAGFESAPLAVKSRATGFFSPELPLRSQLDAIVVWVRAGGKDYFLDPATRYCPFDLLPWSETATTGVAVTETPLPIHESGANKNFDYLVSTPAPSSKGAVIDRKAVLQIDAAGAVEGSIAVSYSGQDALDRRIAARNLDEAARKNELEEEVKRWVPATASVELTGAVNWDQAEQPLRASFSVKVPDFAAITGRRMLFRAGFFEGTAKSFQSATRVHDVYVPYPFEENDDLIWKLPAGYRAGSLPQKSNLNTDYGSYALSVEAQDSAVHSKRNFTVRIVFLPVRYYGAMRAVFNTARVGDASQVILDREEGKDAGKLY